MENQEPWEPTFSAGYTLTPEAAYGGNMSTRPTPGPTHPARWPTSEALTAPAVAAAETVAPTLKAEPARRSGGRVVGGHPGPGGGGLGGSGAGDEERLNSMAYNNAYAKVRWGLFRHAGAMILITCKASLAGVDLPALLLDTNCKACPAFHIKGMCNTGCGNAADHVAHNREQSRTSPFGDGPLGQCRRLRRPRLRSPRKLAGDQNVCSLSQPQTPPCL